MQPSTSLPPACRFFRCRLALLILPFLLAACASGPRQAAVPVPVPVHEVFLLVGQSNMSGRGQGADPLAQGAQALSRRPFQARLLMWDPAAQRLAPARDPLPHQDLGVRAVAVGPGVSFGGAWLARGGQDGSLVLVPAAFGGTGFSDAAGSWRVTGATVSPLALEAVARANAAMRAVRAAGAPVRFAGILWHQGETDGVNRMSAAGYATELTALAGYLRRHIDGAGPATPFVVGQYVPGQIAASPALRAIAEFNRALPRTLAHSACAGSRGLSGNAAPDTIHFDAASQRTMGERYAAALDAVLRGATAAPCDW